ncbi:MAG TPA: NAD(P)H-dependent glycerol-3-phosphate dehydrogenase, partial [Dongiaceae bacterium]|nr:NAD(P)H-dependent glycerol-3-phosphate dehydrogenase [Dongiaceae bacterium]
MTRVAVLGAGSWGTTLAIHLANAGHDAELWGHEPDELARIEAARENRKFLPSISLPRAVKVQPQLEVALAGSEFVLFVVPSQAVREVARRVAVTGIAVRCAISASKGFELATRERLSQVLSESLPGASVVVLTGPSHAEEVSRGIPTSVVAASADEGAAASVQRLLATSAFRVYTNSDVIGCEVAAGVKNVIAIAAGVCDGVGFGDNTKGALLTRGLAEISRLGVAMGGRRETFFGLAGMGDLIATAMSRHSRNRYVGERLGRGEKLEAVLESMTMVAEGVPAARAAGELGRERG